MVAGWALVTVVAKVARVNVVVMAVTMEVVIVRSYFMMIATCIETMNVMNMAVCTAIGVVAAWNLVIVERMVVINLMNAEVP